MPEIIGDKQVFSLQEVCNSVSKTIKARYSSHFWIKAEINKLNLYPHRGHCYPELVQKEDQKVVAEMKSVLWRNDVIRINRMFEAVVGEPLKDGIKVLMQAGIQFDPVYGLSLQIVDIDPSFTLGDLAREKAETIAYLKQHGLYHLNQQLTLAFPAKRIAIISVETSKGYADFLKVLHENRFGLTFFHMLFPSLLQGEKAVHDIIQQLQRILKVKEHFDLVAIIRGGGGDIGLSCYNHIALAKAVACFPLPIFTGIGHATNFTVVEMVSHTHAITPSKIAEHLIAMHSDPLQRLKHIQSSLLIHAQQQVNKRILQLQNTTFQFTSGTQKHLHIHLQHMRTSGRKLHHLSRLNLQKKELAIRQFQHGVNQHSSYILKSSLPLLQQLSVRLKSTSDYLLDSQQNKLEYCGKNLQSLRPENTLQRGYSITRFQEKALLNPQHLQPEDLIETTLLHGTVVSKVINIRLPHPHDILGNDTIKP